MPRKRKPWGAIALVRSLSILLASSLAVNSVNGGDEVTLNLDVKTDNVGSSNDDQFTLRLDGVSTYNFDVNTSDGQSFTHTTNADLTITFPSAGTFTIKLGGTNNILPIISYNNMGDRLKVLRITNQGNIVWASYSQKWRGCSNLIITATDAPNVGSVTSFGGAFNNTGVVSFSYDGWDCTGSNNMEGTHRQMMDMTSLNLNGGDLTTITNLKRFIQDSPLITTITGFDSAGIVPINLQSFAQGATLYDQDLSGLDFSAVTNGTNALLNSSFSTANWDLLIVSLAAQTLQSGWSWHAGSANYTEGQVDSGTTDGATTAFKLIQSGQNFLTTVSINDIIHNTANDTYSKVTNVDSDTQLTLSVDIMSTGETYVVQGSAVAKDRFKLIDSDLLVLTDGGPV